MADTGLQIFKIDLQLFAEKTEKATPRRREQAAEKGQIPRSAEFNSVLVLLAAFIAVKIFAADNFDLTYRTLQNIFIMTVISVTKILAPVVGGAMVAGVVASVAQVGFRFNMSLVKFNLNNVNPINGLKQMFSSQAVAELVKSFLKVFIVGYVAYAEYVKQFSGFAGLTDMNLRASSAYIGQTTMNIAYKIIMWLAVLAVGDYIFQRWRHESQLKMSKQEVKDEYKQQEGDPQLKGKIKQKQRDMAMSRMMQSLPNADVVITNPTHFAVALQYNNSTMGAPVVIAKGQDRVALRIKEIAKEHGIITVENKPLAQALFHGAEIGDAIPAELYQAVAEVLAFVYKLKGKI